MIDHNPIDDHEKSWYIKIPEIFDHVGVMVMMVLKVKYKFEC